jgi:signal transduction histidine kinase
MSASAINLSPEEVFSIKENLRFLYLPDYASFLLRNKLPEFGKEGLIVSRQIKLSLLKFFASFSDDQLLEMGKQGNIDLLIALSENKVLPFIENSLQRWLTNQIPHISRDSVAVEDITMVSLLRRTVFRNLMPSYTSDITKVIKILEEVDKFTIALDTICLNRLAALQQDLFKQAEKLGNIGSWVMNLETGKLLWSDEMFRIYEMEPEADLDKEKAGILNHPDDQLVVTKNIQGALVDHRPYDFYYRIQLPDGRLKHIHAKGEVRLKKNGEPSELFGSAQDVTLQKNTEDLQRLLTLRLEEQNNELQQKNRDLESFNYVASHDLQEPLRKIMIFSNMIVDQQAKGLTDDFDNYFEKMNSAARRMRELIDNLLAFSSIQNKVESYQTVDLDDLIKSALGSLSMSLLETNAEVHFDTRATITVIPFQFRQAMENLLSNALKYRRKGVAPIIEISSRKIKGSEIRQLGAIAEKEYLKIAVSDNGIGFNPDYIEKIFQPFQRLHGKEEYPGTGIGLSISKKIIDIHNGFIWASSEENKGSTFYLYLPFR